MDKKALVEASQELVRLVFFAVLGVGISFGLGKLADVPQTETTVIFVAVLKWLDRYVHENKDIKLNGLTDTKLIGI